MSEFESARRNMVENQLRPSNVDDARILAAMGDVPRELFLPKRLRGVAYCDEDIDLGEDRHLIEPLVLARMLQTAGAESDEVALVGGCDSGYCAAVLSKLVATVFLLMPDRGHAEPVENLLDELSADNVVVQAGDIRKGLVEQAPFNLILLAGSVSSPPQHLIGQLEDGGRLVAVVQTGRSGNITMVKRVGASSGHVSPFDASLPPIPQLQEEGGFVF